MNPLKPDCCGIGSNARATLPPASNTIAEIATIKPFLNMGLLLMVWFVKALNLTATACI
jgi:hypothetical protein